MRNLIYFLCGLALVVLIFFTLPPALRLLDASITPAQLHQLTLSARLAEGERQATQTQRLAELQGKLDQLAKIESSEVTAILDMLSRVPGTPGTPGATSAPNRAFEPVASAEGDFDPDTASLYDIVRRKDDDGKLVFVFTYVDAGGRTLQHEQTPEEMSRDDMIAWQIFEMSRKNQNLRLLVDSVRRMADEGGE